MYSTTEVAILLKISRRMVSRYAKRTGCKKVGCGKRANYVLTDRDVNKIKQFIRGKSK